MLCTASHVRGRLIKTLVDQEFVLWVASLPISEPEASFAMTMDKKAARECASSCGNSRASFCLETKWVGSFTNEVALPDRGCLHEAAFEIT